LKHWFLLCSENFSHGRVCSFSLLIDLLKSRGILQFRADKKTYDPYQAASDEWNTPSPGSHVIITESYRQHQYQRSSDKVDQLNQKLEKARSKPAQLR